MIENNSIQSLLGQTDIYLVDQIMKGRYKPDGVILDAGCGAGRNLHWFIQNNFNIVAVDTSDDAIVGLRKQYAGIPADRFLTSSIETINFINNYFDDIICSAVLHFAANTAQFKKMFSELVRVLKPGGSLFIRMASEIGIEKNIQHISDGVYRIPDGSKRFLLTRVLLAQCMLQNNLRFLEPLKTVNVDDIRCMSTLVLQKA